MVVFLEVISGLGLDNIITKQIIETKERSDAILSTSIFIRIVFSTFLFFASLIVIHYLDLNHDIASLCYVMFSAVIFRSLDVFDYYLQAEQNFKYAVYAKVVSFAVYAAIRLTVISFNFDLFYLGVAFLAEGSIRSLMLLIFFLRKKISLKFSKIEWLVAKDLVNKSWPLLFSAISVMIYMKIDLVMLGAMINSTEVGIYASAARISELFYNIPVIISATTFPMLVGLQVDYPDLLKDRFQQLYDINSFVLITLSLILFLFADTIIISLFGQAYSQAIPVLKVHVWSSIFIGFSMVRGKWLIIENLQHITLYCHLGGAIVNVLLNIILIPVYGGVGAAVATLVSYCFSTIVMSSFFKKLIPDLKRQLHSINLLNGLNWMISFVRK